MTERREVPEEQRRCMHHEAVSIRLMTNEKEIHDVKRGLFWIYTLLVANLFSVLTLLMLQLNKPSEGKTAIAAIKQFIFDVI